MPVKFWHASLRFWFFFSNLITTVKVARWKICLCRILNTQQNYNQGWIFYSCHSVFTFLRTVLFSFWITGSQLVQWSFLQKTKRNPDYQFYAEKNKCWCMFLPPLIFVKFHKIVSKHYFQDNLIISG